MFGSIAVSSTHSLDEYTPIVGEEAIASLRELAEPLRGVRVLELSSPGASGAVRSTLQSKVPLLVDLGLDVHWQQVRVQAKHLDMDRDLRWALSGAAIQWGAQYESDWRDFNQANAELFDEEFDIVLVHHTGSVGLHAALSRLLGRPPAGRWIWDSHRDYRAAVPEAWSLVRMHADAFDASVYDYKEFIRPDAPTRRRVVIPPGVDPLGPRSRPVSKEVRETILAQRGLDLNRPIIGQIVLSIREDDPLRVLDAFELVKAQQPDAQLLVLNLLTDGPELTESLNLLRKRGKDIGDVFVLSETDRVGNVELSALRDESTVLVHQGMPRGISVELLEEMWHSRPIVSGRSSVAEAVLTHRRTAILADDVADQAKAILSLLATPGLAARIGGAAHARIASRYLISHHVASYLRLFQQVLHISPTSRRSG